MKTKLILAWLGMVCCLALNSPASEASLVVYKGNGAAAGLSATADFQLLNGGTQLHIDLVNTSINPMPGWDQVLNSINFKLPTAIHGGDANLMPDSDIVRGTAGSWTSSGFTGNLNTQYSFSNNGVNNHKAYSAILSNVDMAEVQALKQSVTSMTHWKLNRFDGQKAGLNGLDFGLVTGNKAFGQSQFIQSRLSIDLQLDAPLANLDFLANGSYVEFGNNHAFIGGAAVPEPGSMMVWGVILAGCLVTARRRSNS